MSPVIGAIRAIQGRSWEPRRPPGPAAGLPDQPAHDWGQSHSEPARDLSEGLPVARGRTFGLGTVIGFGFEQGLGSATRISPISVQLGGQAGGPFGQRP